jgi:E3 ubiquitin-protein ligase RNF25
MAQLPEELSIEVEALGHLYGDEAFSISSEGTLTTLTIPLLPRQLDGEHEAYVTSVLKVQIDNQTYPTTAAMITLEETKGLTDAACIQLQAALQAEADNLVGEMVLGHLCELALDLLTDANHPTGNCIFCLNAILEGNSTTTGNLASYQVLKLPCFHCFHFPCFTAWYQWQQAAAAAAASEVVAPGQPLPPAGQDVECENGWTAKNVYTIKCPSCRLEVPPNALRHALPQLLGLAVIQQQQRNATSPATPPSIKNINQSPSVATWSAEHPRTKDVLSPQALKQLRHMQKRFKHVLDLQRACGGLVQENVAVSVAELEAAAAEKRQQQQQQKQEEEVKQVKESNSSNPNKTASSHKEGGERGGGRSVGGRSSNGGGGGGSRGRGYRGRGGGKNHPPPPS